MRNIVTIDIRRFHKVNYDIVTRKTTFDFLLVTSNTYIYAVIYSFLKSICCPLGNLRYMCLHGYE